MQKSGSLFSFLLIFCRAVQASHSIPLEIEELSRHSELILCGTVLSRSCQRDAAGQIYTKVELQVAEVWKGAVTNQLFTIVHGGGILGDRRVSVSDQFEF